MRFFVHFVLEASSILARQNYLHLGKPTLDWLVGNSTKQMSVLLTAFVLGGQS